MCLSSETESPEQLHHQGIAQSKLGDPGGRVCAGIRRRSTPGVPTGGLRGADRQPPGERIQRVGRSTDLPDRCGRSPAGHALLLGDLRRERQGPQRSVAVGGHNAARLGKTYR